MEITSPSNPRVKHFCTLSEKSRLRKEEGLAPVEGQRELLHAAENGYTACEVFLCEAIAPSGARELAEKLLSDSDGLLYLVSEEVYAKIALRESTEGIAALIHTKDHSLAGLNIGENPFIVVIESVEKPGNIGAILRSCDAAGVDALVVCDPLSDIYNPNLVRASLGAVFSVQVAVCNSQEAIKWLKDKGIRIYTAQLQDSSLYYDTDFRGPSAIVMGTESTGLTQIWRDAADAHIRIPMLGCLDSLNVSASSAILIFEALRQRQ